MDNTIAYLNTIVAAAISTIGCIVWLYIIIKLAVRKSSAIKIVFSIVGFITSLWCASLYFIILSGYPIEPSIFFRPVNPFLIVLGLVGGIGMVERGDDKEIIERLTKQNKELQKTVEVCRKIADGLN